MRSYRFTRRYRSHLGTWKAGEVVVFDDTTAAWLNRDSPGCIEPVEEPERAMDAPPQDRQVKRAPRKRSKA